MVVGVVGVTVFGGSLVVGHVLASLVLCVLISLALNLVSTHLMYLIHTTALIQLICAAALIWLIRSAALM